jgi:hypothetical protein
MSKNIKVYEKDKPLQKIKALQGDWGVKTEESDIDRTVYSTWVVLRSIL